VSALPASNPAIDRADALHLGVAIHETWSFFHEVYADLAAHFQTSLFEPRLSRFPFFKERMNRNLFERDLARFLSANQVIFFEWASDWLAAASHLPKRSAVVCRLHRYELYQWADAVNWDGVDRVILVSEAKRREFAARFPAQAGKTAVVPEAISLSRFQPLDRPFGGDLGILCHLSPRKRVYELILAFSELAPRSAKFHLHIGGGPHPRFPDYPYVLKDLVSRLGLQDRVTFYGDVKDPEAWYRRIDIFISNSYSEGLQVSPMEAIASGCYCLSHCWDGAGELLPGENLYLTDQQLVEKVLAFSQAAAPLRRRMRERLRGLIVENFNVDRTKLRIRQLIEQTGRQYA
jgi:glycosyltransferase involved in cell wall biosynthesis